MASQHLFVIVMLGLVKVFVVLSCQNLAVQHFMKIAPVILAKQKKTVPDDNESLADCIIKIGIVK